jgi:hypothetical protein
MTTPQIQFKPLHLVRFGVLQSHNHLDRSGVAYIVLHKSLPSIYYVYRLLVKGSPGGGKNIPSVAYNMIFLK